MGHWAWAYGDGDGERERPEGMVAVGRGAAVEEGPGHVHITASEGQQQTGHLLLIGCLADLVVRKKRKQQGKHLGAAPVARLQECCTSPSIPNIPQVR